MDDYTQNCKFYITPSPKENGKYQCFTPYFPNQIAEGASPQQALKRAKILIDAKVLEYRKQGKPLPESQLYDKADYLFDAAELTFFTEIGFILKPVNKFSYSKYLPKGLVPKIYLTNVRVYVHEGHIDIKAIRGKTRWVKGKKFISDEDTSFIYFNANLVKKTWFTRRPYIENAFYFPLTEDGNLEGQSFEIQITREQIYIDNEETT